MEPLSHCVDTGSQAERVRRCYLMQQWRLLWGMAVALQRLCYAPIVDCSVWKSGFIRSGDPRISIFPFVITEMVAFRKIVPFSLYLKPCMAWSLSLTTSSDLKSDPLLA